jgi:hypothetical protein
MLASLPPPEDLDAWAKALRDVERHAAPSSAARVVCKTDRCGEMFSHSRSCVAAIGRGRAAHLGAQRSKALHQTLRDLSVWLGKLR